jgi:hypothetical protein
MHHHVGAGLAFLVFLAGSAGAYVIRAVLRRYL